MLQYFNTETPLTKIFSLQLWIRNCWLTHVGLKPENWVKIELSWQTKKINPYETPPNYAQQKQRLCFRSQKINYSQILLHPLTKTAWTYLSFPDKRGNILL